MSRRVLILCGGRPRPFGNPFGLPRHLITVEGEALVARTVRQALQYTPDVHVIGPPGDERYAVEGAQRHDENLNHPLSNVSNHFWPSRHLWHENGMTILLLGDVWFDDRDMCLIMQNQRESARFQRSEGSCCTGCDYGEIWAWAFTTPKADWMDRQIAARAKTLNLYGGGAISGWDIHMEHHIETGYTWTEDFDSPRDLQEWTKRRKAHADYQQRSY